MPNKWNKDKEGAWRLDVDIGVSWFDKGDDNMEEEDGIAISDILDGGDNSDEDEDPSSDEISSGIDSSSNGSGD